MTDLYHLATIGNGIIERQHPHQVIRLPIQVKVDLTFVCLPVIPVCLFDGFGQPHLLAMG